MTKTEENGPSKEKEENVQAWGLLTAASVKVYNLKIGESEDLQVKVKVGKNPRHANSYQIDSGYPYAQE